MQSGAEIVLVCVFSGMTGRQIAPLSPLRRMLTCVHATYGRWELMPCQDILTLNILCPDICSGFAFCLNVPSIQRDNCTTLPRRITKKQFPEKIHKLLQRCCFSRPFMRVLNYKWANFMKSVRSMSRSYFTPKPKRNRKELHIF